MKSVRENEANMVDLVTPRRGQGLWKWYNMVEINGAYKHADIKNGLKCLFVMSNVKAFCHARLSATRPARRTRLITQICNVLVSLKIINNLERYDHDINESKCQQK